MKLLFALNLLLLVCASLVSAQDNAALNEMVKTEREFAATAAAQNTKAAFLQFTASDGVMIGDARKIARVKEIWEKRPESKTFLAWEPNFAGIGASGTIGFTTGAWDLRPDGKTGASTAFGQFATVWKKQADGTWRFVFDIGVQHGKPDAAQTAAFQQASLLPNGKKKSFETGDWRRLENEFNVMLAQKGERKTYEKYAHDNIRLLRNNQFPYIGKKAALTAATVENSRLKLVAGNGETVEDFSYAFGDYEITDATNKTEKGVFLHVWKREPAGWRLVLDLLHPFAPPPAKK
jgi:ketosteroid isomerase-like protein